MPADETLKAPAAPELAAEVFATMEDKAALPWGRMLGLAVLAGAYIGLGGMFATVALAGAEGLPYGVAQIAAGVVFAMGLLLVLVAGAELFTGNLLMAGPVALGRIAPARAGGVLALVYAGNFAGSLVIVALAYGAGLQEGGNGAVGRAAQDLAAGKLDKSFATTFASGILANMLVCLAVWMAHAGRTVGAKLAGLLLPIAAFVAAGFEHSVANMYLLPYAWMAQEGGQAITWGGIAANLVPATLGNMLGGAAVALAYAFIYRPEPFDA